MTTDTESSVDRRLVQLFRHLGLEQVHIAARVTADWHGLATTHPETIASLTLVCPTGLEATPLGALASRVLVLTGDQGAPAEAIRKAMAALPEATLITLHDYYSHTRADLLTDHPEDIGAAMLAFLARLDQGHTVKTVSLPAQEGELDGISYRIQGAGAPLVLLPLGLAAAQWPEFQPELAEEEEIEIVIQINGRVRAKFSVEPGLNSEELYARAVADARIAPLVARQRIVKKIVVPNKLVNIVVAQGKETQV